jgi:tetratricopeptide (TPR) repeat protein
MHPLLHNYAGMRARQLPEHAAGMIKRHAHYFGIEIGGSYQKAINHEQDALPALQQIDRERDTVLIAQERALEVGFPIPELAVNLTDVLTIYWRQRHIPTDTFLKWLNIALNLSRSTKQRRQEAALLRAIGDAHSFHDDLDAALDLYKEALALFREIGETLGQANAFLSMADITNNPDEYEEAIRLYEQIGDRYSIGRGKAYYGLMLMDSSDSERGVKLLREARDEWAAINHTSGVQFIDEILAE